jgi:hypothetical protein
MTDKKGISRRRVLTVAAGAAGAVSGVAAMVGTTPALAAKVSQKSVRYQDTPKGEQRCDNCALFEAPSSCKTVISAIVNATIGAILLLLVIRLFRGGSGWGSRWSGGWGRRW